MTKTALITGITGQDGAHLAVFIRENLAIQGNRIHAAFSNAVKRLLFLGSSCIYLKFAPQPLKEEYLLTGPLEPTKRAYTLARIAGVEMCWSYNRLYSTRYLAAMPTNLYGPGDNYRPENNHVIPALIRKFHEVEQIGAASVTVLGSGKPRREFLYMDDMADACVFQMNLSDATFEGLLGSDETKTGRFEPPLVNIARGEDLTIKGLAEIVREVVGFTSAIVQDVGKLDGTQRKLLDIPRLGAIGWEPTTELRAGLAQAYASAVFG